MAKIEEIKDTNIRKFKNKNSDGEYLKITGENTRAMVAEVKDYRGKKSSVVICECTEIDLL